MDAPEVTVRRATVDCLPALREFWSECGAPVELLERRLTEFQVADMDGVVFATAALHVAGKDGRIHSEFALPGSEDVAGVLRERLVTLAANMGLHRLWKAPDATGWEDFRKPFEAELAKLPEAFKLEGDHWEIRKLRDDLNAAGAEEFLILQQAMQAESARMLDRARVVRLVAYILAFVVGILVVFLIFAYFKYSKGKGTAAIAPAPQVRLCA